MKWILDGMPKTFRNCSEINSDEDVDNARSEEETSINFIITPILRPIFGHDHHHRHHRTTDKS